MKQSTFPKEILTELRKGLPQGAQTRIAQALSTPEQPITPHDVSQVLRGIRKKFGRLDPAMIIKEAAKIYLEVKTSSNEAMEALNEVINTTN